MVAIGAVNVRPSAVAGGQVRDDISAIGRTFCL